MMFKPEVIKQKKGENRRSKNSRNTRCYDKTSKKCQGKTITVALRATQRLGALRKAFHLLDVPGRIQAYNAFVRPVMEYCPIVWMGAAPSHLARLDRVQARAIRAIAPMCWLPSLALRRMVAALCLLYKMHCPDAHPLLQRMLQPQKPQHKNSPLHP